MPIASCTSYVTIYLDEGFFSPNLAVPSVAQYIVIVRPRGVEAGTLPGFMRAPTLLTYIVTLSSKYAKHAIPRRPCIVRTSISGTVVCFSLRGNLYTACASAQQAMQCRGSAPAPPCATHLSTRITFIFALTKSVQ